MRLRGIFSVFLIILAGLYPAMVMATTMVNVEVVCPVCGNSVSARELMSTNTFGGVDTDMLPRAMGASPVLIRPIVCLGCSYAGYIDDFSDERKAKITQQLSEAILQKKVLQPEIALGSFSSNIDVPAWVKYDLIGQVRELEGAPAGEIATQYLCAAWAVRLEDRLFSVVDKDDLEKLFALIKELFAERLKNREVNPAQLNYEIAAELEKIAGAQKSDPEKARIALTGALLKAREHGENPMVLRIMAELFPLVEKEYGKRLEFFVAESVGREQKFQEKALEAFIIASEDETAAELKARMLYLVGELSRRTGNYKDARKWFEKFRQVNNRLEFLDDLLKEVESRIP